MDEAADSRRESREQLLVGTGQDFARAAPSNWLSEQNPYTRLGGDAAARTS
jgi:hypothetical protein